MKKFYSLLAVVAMTASVSAQTEVVNEDFNYVAAALNTKGWSSHGGATPGQLKTDGTKATLKSTDTEDVNKAFSADYTIASLNKTEYTATINVPNATGLTTGGDYFLMLSNASGTTGVTNFYARVYIKSSTASGYLLGILNNSGGTATPTYSTTEIPYGANTQIKVTYVVNATSSTASLAIDSQTVLNNSAGTGASPSVLKSVALRQGNNTGNVTVDNLIVSTYAPETLAVGDVNKTKVNLVKNTIVANDIIFGATANVSVYNTAGQVVKTAEVTENSKLDVSALPKGTYVVTGLVNGQTVSQKVIKK